MNERSVCIYGAGGHASVVAETLRASDRRIELFFDDNRSVVETSNGQYQPGLSLVGEQDFRIPDLPFLLAIGSNRVRADLASRLRAQYTTAIHPSAVVTPSASVGAGSVVFAQAVLQPNSHVAEHVIINTAASVDHDCVVGSFAHVSPNATLCGNVQVGEGTHVGAGSTIIEGVRVGRWAVIGAGAVVIRDVPDFTTVVGCPARAITVSEPYEMKDASNEHIHLLDIVNGIRKDAKRSKLQYLSPDQKLQQDLQLDSLQLAEMTVLIESRFGVDVFDQGIVTTVQDVIDRIQKG